MKRKILGLLLLASFSTQAAWTSTPGKVTSIITYAHTETVLVKLSINGASVKHCSNKTEFAISKSISPEARARMYSMLLSAQATGRTVVVSYNEAGDCEPWDSDPSVYRKIVRLR